MARNRFLFFIRVERATVDADEVSQDLYILPGFSAGFPLVGDPVLMSGRGNMLNGGQYSDPLFYYSDS